MYARIAPCNAACKRASDRIGALIEGGRYEDALAESEKEIKKDPSCPSACAHHAAALNGLGEHGQCLYEARTGKMAHPQEAEFYVLEASAMMGIGAITSAARALSIAVRLCPSSADIRSIYAAALISSGRTDAGIAEIKRACELDPENPDAFRHAAESMLAAGDLDGALAHSKAAVGLAPKDVGANIIHAAALMGLGDGEAVHRAAEEMVKRIPDSPEALLTRAVSHAHLGRAKEAYEDASDACRLDGSGLLAAPGSLPKSPAAAAKAVLAMRKGLIGSNYDMGMADMYAQALKSPAKALREIRRRAKEFADENSASPGELNRPAIDPSACRQALAEAESDCRADPGNAELHLVRAELLYDLGRFEDALESAVQAAQLGLDSYVLRAQTGQILVKLDRFDEAIAELDAALAIWPRGREAQDSKAFAAKMRSVPRPKAGAKRAAALYLQAESLVQAGDGHGAISAYEKIAKLEPENPVPRACIAHQLLVMRRFEESLAQFDAAIALDNTDKITHGNRGIVLLQLGRAEEAVAAFDRSLEIDSSYAYANMHKSDALLRLGRKPESEVHMERALRADPDLVARHLAGS